MKNFAENGLSIFLVFVGTLVVVGSLVLTAFLTENISKNFLLDLGYAAGIAPLVWGISLLRKKQDKATRGNEVIAMIAKFRTSDVEVNDRERDIFSQVYGFSHDQVRKSEATTSIANIKIQLQEATDHWSQTFPLLSQCADFDRAWNIYFAMGNNVKSALSDAENLGHIIGDLSGTNSTLRKSGELLPDFAHKRISHDVTIAIRALEAAISRRDESAAAIPSLRLTNSGYNGNIPTESNGYERREFEDFRDDMDYRARLANFWYLFDIATTDMRQAYLPIYRVNQRTYPNAESDLLLSRATLGACLERIRNCHRILEVLDDNPYQRGEGNTTISDEDLLILVNKAKGIERGETSQHTNILPANFGVMIRDLETSLKAIDRAYVSFVTRQN